MEDTASKQFVLDIAKLLDEHKGRNTIVLDVRGLNSWTDYFIITTVQSSAHSAGLMRYLQIYFKENNIHPVNQRKSTGYAGWLLLDCGNFIVNLMEEEKRNFYELERLWFKAGVLYQSSKLS